MSANIFLLYLTLVCALLIFEVCIAIPVTNSDENSISAEPPTTQYYTTRHTTPPVDRFLVDFPCRDGYVKHGAECVPEY